MRSSDDTGRGIDIGFACALIIITLAGWAGNKLHGALIKKKKLFIFDRFVFVIIGAATGIVSAYNGLLISFKVIDWRYYTVSGNQERVIIMFCYLALAVIGGGLANTLVKKYLSNNA